MLKTKFQSIIMLDEASNFLVTRDQVHTQLRETFKRAWAAEFKGRMQGPDGSFGHCTAGSRSLGECYVVIAFGDDYEHAEVSYYLDLNTNVSVSCGNSEAPDFRFTNPTALVKFFDMWVPLAVEFAKLQDANASCTVSIPWHQLTEFTGGKTYGLPAPNRGKQS